MTPHEFAQHGREVCVVGVRANVFDQIAGGAVFGVLVDVIGDVGERGGWLRCEDRHAGTVCLEMVTPGRNRENFCKNIWCPRQDSNLIGVLALLVVLPAVLVL